MTQKIILRWKEHNDLLSKKYEKTCKYLNYIEHFVTLVSTVAGCIYIFVFVSLACVPAGFKGYAVVIKLCAIISGIKKYKSSITKNKKKHDKILLLGKSKLNTIEVLISESLINSYISQYEFSFSK